MEEIEKLYNVLINKKLYSKSLEDFQVQFSDPEYVDKVYNVVTDRKLYSKDKESASPGYYQVMLDRYNIKVELTATERSGLHKYTFPESSE